MAKIEALVERRKHKQFLRELLQASGENRTWEVDPDARVLKRSGGTVGGHNRQMTVDDRYRLIVAEDVVQYGNEAGQVEPMTTKAGGAMGAERFTGAGGAPGCRGPGRARSPSRRR